MSNRGLTLFVSVPSGSLLLENDRHRWWWLREAPRVAVLSYRHFPQRKWLRGGHHERDGSGAAADDLWNGSYTNERHRKRRIFWFYNMESVWRYETVFFASAHVPGGQMVSTVEWLCIATSVWRAGGTSSRLSSVLLGAGEKLWISGISGLLLRGSASGR